MSSDIRERMQGLRIDVAPATAGNHHAAIAAELRSPSPIPPRRFRRRRLAVVALAAAVLVVLSAAGAVAAERSVPGDRLYPVKQATEWMRTWIDHTVPADHRIDELETLIKRHAAHDAISDQLRRAEDAVAEASVGDPLVDAPLVDRLDRVRDRVPPVMDRPEKPVVSDQPLDTQPIGDEVHEPDAPPVDQPRTNEEARSDARHTQCKKAAVAAEHAGTEVPQWVKRLCDRASSPPGDGPPRP